MLASIVRFHRRGVANSSYPPFQALDADGQQRARRLAAILHLADAADRSLDQSVESIHLSLANGKVTASFEGADLETRRGWVESAETALWQGFDVRLIFEGVRIVDSFLRAWAESARRRRPQYSPGLLADGSPMGAFRCNSVRGLSPRNDFMRRAQMPRTRAMHVVLAA